MAGNTARERSRIDNYSIGDSQKTRVLLSSCLRFEPETFALRLSFVFFLLFPTHRDFFSCLLRRAGRRPATNPTLPSPSVSYVGVPARVYRRQVFITFVFAPKVILDASMPITPDLSCCRSYDML